MLYSAVTTDESDELPLGRRIHGDGHGDRQVQNPDGVAGLNQ